MKSKLIGAVKHYRAERHEIEAWQNLESQLAPQLVDEFLDLFYKRRRKITSNWQRIYDAAAAAGAKYPEVVAAQWALESSWGRAISGRNNFFGIKGPGTTKKTWEDYGEGPVTIYDSFLDFDSLTSCVKYLVDRWYKDWQNYRGVNRAQSYQECAHLLKSEGYATDPDYAKKLIDIIQGEHRSKDSHA
ncbi:flagellar assembly peptidoglycan hydrolase FlgJ [cyanobiont of Ornithocercus magnificus]|nr:flagellar assembly peptidoglycan hydrolase FlgJ [cyanobiont of Ornithocercus magnificus]